MTVGQVVRRLDAERRRQGLTARELVQRAGSTKSDLWARWLRGERAPQLGTLLRYCAALGLEIRLNRREITTQNEMMKALDEAREARGVSGRKLCGMAGHSSTSLYSQWMYGTVRPQLDTLLDFLNVLDAELVIRRKEGAE